MPAETEDSGFKQIHVNGTYRCWKLLEHWHKPKCLIAVDGFVLVFRPKSSSLNIHELIAADRYNLDSFPNSLDLEQSSVSLGIIERLGADDFWWLPWPLS